jgi:hypothetical protein
LPWNPAVLEQRIARAHRMGQRRHVDVYLLVSTETFEERLLGTLSDKRDLASAALDAESDVSEMQLRSNMDDLKRRLERLLGEPPAAPEQRQAKAQAEREAAEVDEREQRVAAAGAGVVTAVCQLVGELASNGKAGEPDPAVVSQVRSGLETVVGQDSRGRPQLQLPLPDDNSLDQIAGALAQLVGLSQRGAAAEQDS